MRKRHTYEYIKQYFEDSGCELLSKTYEKNDLPLDYKCSCGNISKITFRNFQSGQRCKKCATERANKNRIKPIEEVNMFFNDKGYKIIDGLDDYKNSKSKLITLCPNGHIYKVDYNSFYNGHRCPECQGIIRYNIETVKEIFENKNYILLEDTYMNSNFLMKYVCQKHPCEVQYISLHNLLNGSMCRFCRNENNDIPSRYTLKDLQKIFNDNNCTLLSDVYKNEDSNLFYMCNEHKEHGIFITKLRKFLKNMFKCPICYKENYIGENHPLWKGNSSERERIMASSEYKEWRNLVFIRDDYTCQCCGKKGVKLNAHHKFNFSTNEDLRFDVNNGITLCEDCHKEFHSIYGIKNNNFKQLKEFINYYIFRRCPNLSNKYLTLSTLKKFDSQFKNTKEVVLSNSYVIQIDLHFRQSVIEEVFDKLLEIQNIIQQNKDDESLKNFPFEKYSLLLLILNFTSLKNIKPKSINEEIQIMRMLIDQNLFKEIIEKMEEFCSEQIKFFTQKIFEIMQEKIDSLKQQQEFYDILEKEMDKVNEIGEIEQQEKSEEGDDFGLIGTTTFGNTEKITTEN